MDRVIKFRAWNGKKFWYSDDEAYVLKMFNGELWLCEDADFYRENLSGNERFEKIGKAIQFTGLKDMDGVDIFEGDIVLCSSKRKLVVIYQAPSFVMKEKIKKGLSKQWSEFILPYYENQFEKVIGNIHQHKELLNADSNE